jgi:hypothetical protein
MNKTEAKLLVARELKAFAARSYSELSAMIGQTEVKRLVGDSGKEYQIELEVFWDSTQHENLHIMGSIDDGGWRAFLPICDSLIMKPDGTLI